MDGTPPSAHILLVDDDAQFREMLVVVLTRAGYTVTEAHNGKSALLQHQQQQVDAVILDVIMPDMDGIEALRALRRVDPELPIVVMSGGGRLTADCYLPAAKRLGAAATLEKPFTPDDLTRALAGALAARTRGSSTPPTA